MRFLFVFLCGLMVFGLLGCEKDGYEAIVVRDIRFDDGGTLNAGTEVVISPDKKYSGESIMYYPAEKNGQLQYSLSPRSFIKKDYYKYYLQDIKDDSADVERKYSAWSELVIDSSKVSANLYKTNFDGTTLEDEFKDVDLFELKKDKLNISRDQVCAVCFFGDKNKYLELPAGSVISLFGPPGTFFVLQPKGEDPQLKTIRPLVSKKLQDIFKKQILSYIVLERDYRLYFGFYYPGRQSLHPLPHDAITATVGVYHSILNGVLISDRFNKKIEKYKETDENLTFKDLGDCLKYDFEVNPIIEPARMVFFIGIALFSIFFCLLAIFFSKKEISDLRKRAFEPKSMRDLHLAGQKEFLCVYCTEPLKMEGLFKCIAGHVPKKETSIFEICQTCEYKAKKIKCLKCRKEIELDEELYNEEEIQNRGKEYITRPHPMRKIIKRLSGPAFVASIFAIFIYSTTFPAAQFFIEGKEVRGLIHGLHTDIYYQGNVFLTMISLGNTIHGEILHYILLSVIFILVFYFGYPKKEILLRNPYYDKKTS